MWFEEDQERIKDLKLILERVAFAATLFDKDGISVRFMNDEPLGNDGRPLQQDNIASEEHVKFLMEKVKWKG
jgi:hypothetical protein